MYTIRNAQVEDALYFAENMRTEDREENSIIRAFIKSDESEVEGLRRGILGGECYVGEYEGEAVFIFGAVAIDDGLTAIGWNICTPGVDNCKLFVYETAHGFNAHLKENYAVIMNLIHKENKTAWRLAQKLGAQFEKINEDIYLFHIMGAKYV